MSHPTGKWDIDPYGVNSVVDKAGDAAKDLAAEAKSYAGNLEDAAKYAGTLSGEGMTTGLVGIALGQFAEATEAAVKYLFTRSGKSLNGAIDATKQYLNGDVQMAAHVQSAASQDHGSPAYVLPEQGTK
ncbi:DUF6507 family protein [Streptomyces sp. PTM05]|uniref:DUF6507 family protein n=1 Tax=Streptantibioticus parmotrematis TaxID=2873249 RepID=A0ABS7QW45_9ACTN|nr:DUF6507 family protein [Streptantibioticus parmotrematis]MBY8886575.1 DUF6507 family protein [Streptantibioticus parmotrematis]